MIYLIDWLNQITLGNFSSSALFAQGDEDLQISNSACVLFFSYVPWLLAGGLLSLRAFITWILSYMYRACTGCTRIVCSIFIRPQKTNNPKTTLANNYVMCA